MSLIQTITVPSRGVGAPDFGNTVTSARERAGVLLKKNQWLKVAGRSLNRGDIEYPIVVPSPLAAGANTHLTDYETLAPLPYPVPAGFWLTAMDIGWTFNVDAEVYIYIDLGLSTTCIVATGGGVPYYVNGIVSLSTAWYDPTALVAHPYDVKLYNVSGGDLYGGVTISFILEAIGTPPLPSTKSCRCPNCGHYQTEDRHATRIVCTSCGHIYLVADFSNIRMSP